VLERLLSQDNSELGKWRPRVGEIVNDLIFHPPEAAQIVKIITHDLESEFGEYVIKSFSYPYLEYKRPKFLLDKPNGLTYALVRAKMNSKAFKVKHSVFYYVGLGFVLKWVDRWIERIITKNEMDDDEEEQD